MDVDLKSLEDKVAKLISVCVALREENVQLRQEVIKANQDTTKLKNNMLQASTQLEMLLENLPAEDNA